MQDTCHTRTRLNDIVLLEFSQLSGKSAHLDGVREVMVRFMPGIQIFTLFHARVVSSVHFSQVLIILMEFLVTIATE